MSRPTLLVATLVTLFLTAPAPAQQPRADDKPPTASPLDTKPRAKAAWELKQTSIAELRKDRAQEAWLVFEGRFREFWFGRGTLPLEVGEDPVGWIGKPD